MQTSIVIVIDIETALKEGTLDGNSYIIDNTGPFATGPEGTPPGVTNMPGVHNIDGSQAAEAVLNWIAVGVAGLPTTLPRSYRHRFNSAGAERRLLSSLRQARTPGAISKLLAEPDGGSRRPQPLRLRHADGSVHTHDATLVNALGEVPERHDHEAAANLPPVVTGMRGPAVEKGVMYPALYGSPDLQTDGWYWSAAVDTSKHGRYDYILDIALYEPVQQGGETVWQPRPFTLTAGLEVSASLSVNGFTGYVGPGVLPIPPAAPAFAAGDAI